MEDFFSPKSFYRYFLVSIANSFGSGTNPGTPGSSFKRPYVVPLRDSSMKNINTQLTSSPSRFRLSFDFSIQKIFALIENWNFLLRNELNRRGWTGNFIFGKSKLRPRLETFRNYKFLVSCSKLKDCVWHAFPRLGNCLLKLSLSRQSYDEVLDLTRCFSFSLISTLRVIRSN